MLAKIVNDNAGSLNARGALRFSRASSLLQGIEEVLRMLQVDKLHQYYGGSHILRGLSFDVKVG